MVKQNETDDLLPQETAAPPWQFLVHRRHPWRKQLYVRGGNMTARQLVGSIKANQFDEERAAQDFHLPIDAIREALTYVEKNRRLLETESEIERLMCQREEVGNEADRGAQAVP